ncbi:MAG TPA: 5-(carboxyamino)imidazole ribonucleotide mutase [Clostridiales bacterium]|nr:5-(carboxyamino)imidazole ribonucleotide mutase [Clostridiales bacterium]
MKKVAIVMGSKSDLEVVKGAKAILDEFEVENEMKILSAHRTPIEAAEFFSTAKENGFGVIICAAGKAAHLAGVAAGHTTLPVIGIPIKSSTLDGLDSLLSTVQMPPGVPVATVAIDGAKNAGLLAIQILALAEESTKNSSSLTEKLKKYKQNMADKIFLDNESLNK